MTIVHYDADCEIATEVLSFEHRRVLSRGTRSRTRSVCIKWCPRGDTLHTHTPRHLLFRFSDVRDG
jgi:hypothetical protein